MTLRFHEIAESRHRILNPFTAEKLSLLGRICVGERSVRVLDLCCGKAEMLCTWAVDHDVSGVGVDISDVFLEAAQAPAELGSAIESRWCMPTRRSTSSRTTRNSTSSAASGRRGSVEDCSARWT
jgi:hypothetical protein